MAGVAPSTVSRCLREGNYVSENARRRVADAVARLKYEPNEIARSLRGSRSNSIGVIFPQITNAFFSRCIQEIEREATQQGSSVILLTHQEDPERQSRQLALLRRARTDGVILAAAPDSNMDNLRAELGHMPVVALDRTLWEGADVVMLQHRSIAREATQHLIDHGYQQIACVTTNPSIYSFRERILGYEEAMREAGLQSRLLAAPDEEMLRTALDGSFQQHRKPEALFTLSNLATFVAMKAIREIGRRDDCDVALIGFDDVDLATLVSPALTVVVQPTERMAHDSVRILFRKINGGDAEGEICPPFIGRLICRESCGCGKAE